MYENIYYNIIDNLIKSSNFFENVINIYRHKVHIVFFFTNKNYMIESLIQI